MFGKLGTIWAEIGLDTTKLDMGVARAAGSMKGLQGSAGAMAGAFRGVALGVGIVGGAIAAASVKMASDFDSSMRAVWSLTEGNTKQLESWKGKVLEISRELPQSAKEMGDAFYWIVSNMPDATDSERFKTLEVAAKGAVGGMAELSDTVSALTGVQNAYKDNRPDYYMDILAKSVERGALKMEDFVANSGKVVGSAALANVGFEEIGAAVATLTRNGVTADTAFMALNQTIMAFLKPTDEAEKVAKNAGIELSLAALKSKGLAGALLEIGEKVPDDQLAKLFPNIRALKAVFPLASTSAGQFAKDLGEVGNAAGTYERMYGKQADSLAIRWKITLGKIQNAMIKFGDRILPYVTKAVDALGRIFDGKNKAFNAFATGLKIAGTAVLNLADALLKLWPVLLMVAGGFVAFKIAGFVTAISSAASSIPLLNNVIANLQMGFSSSMASVGGFATSLGTIGLLAAPAAIGMAFLVRHIKETEAAADKGWKSMRDYDKVAGENGETLYTLFTRYKELQGVLADTSRSEQEHAAATQELSGVKSEIATKFPEMVAGFDSERQAILKSDEAIQQHIDNLLKYRQMEGGARPDKTNIENYQDITAEMDKIASRRGEVESAMTSVVDAMSKLGDTTGISANIDQLWNDLATDPEAALAAAQRYFDFLKGSGQLPGMGLGEKYFGVEPGSLAEAQKALEAYRVTVDGAGGSLGTLDEKTSEASSTLASLASSMVTAAQQAGVAGQAIPSFIVQAFRSATPQLQQAGVASYAAYLQGVMQNKGMDPNLAGDLAQQMFNTGTFTATGVESVDNALSAMANQIRQSKLADAGADIGKKLAATIQKAFGGGKQEEKKVSVKVSDGGSGRSTTKSLSQVEEKAKAVGHLRPTVRAKGDTSQPNAALSRLLNRVAAIDGKTLATFSLKAQIIGSGPFTVDQYVDHLEKKIGGASPQLTVKANLAGGGVAGPIGTLQKAWAALSSTALVGWSKSVDEAQFGQIEQAIADLGKEIAGPQIQAWRNMRAAYDQANEALAKYQVRIDASEAKLTKLRATQDALNKSLAKHQENLAALSQFKVTGETAASDKSFQMQHELNRLELERLKALDEKRYKDAASIAQQKKKLEKAKELHDLETTYGFEDERYALEKLRNPVQEASYQRIVKATKAEQKAIATTKAQITKVEGQIASEQSYVDKLRASYDATNKAVMDYQTKIDAMANNFLTHYREMIAAQEELNRQMAEGSTGGAAPAYAQGGPITRTGLIYAHAGEYVLSRDMLRAMGGKPTRVESRSSVSNFFFNELTLNGVQNVEGLKTELMNARLRMAVP